MFILAQHQVLPTLSEFIDIENIPKKYGGQLDFECGDVPNLDHDLRDCLTIAPGPDTEQFFLTGPVRWMDVQDDGQMTAVGVGSIDGKQRKENVATLHSVATRVATREGRISRAVTHEGEIPRVTNPQTSVPKAEEYPPAAAPAPTSNGVVMNGGPPNGGPPKNISLPPPPVELGRQETVYVTPASDPAEIKRFDNLNIRD